MNKAFLLVFCLLFIGTAYSQVKIPAFKGNMTSKDNPFPEIKNYDLIIAFRHSSNWSHETKYHILLLQNSQWRKISYIKQHDWDPLALRDSTLKEKATTNAECDSLYKKLVEADLFTMKDDTEEPRCTTGKSIKNGKESTFELSIEDGPEYVFWIITPSKIRHMYYYAPQYFLKYCTTDTTRQFALKNITLFDKVW